MTERTILNRLDDDNVFVIECKGGMFNIYERCDEYYQTSLTAGELRQLAAELIALSNTPTPNA